MKRTVIATVFLALALLAGGCASTDHDGGNARNESGLGDQDLGPTEYDPKYPGEGEEADEDELAEPAPPAREPERADG